MLGRRFLSFTPAITGLTLVSASTNNTSRNDVIHLAIGLTCGELTTMGERRISTQDLGIRSPIRQSLVIFIRVIFGSVTVTSPYLGHLDKSLLMRGVRDARSS